LRKPLRAIFYVRRGPGRYRLPMLDLGFCLIIAVAASAVLVKEAGFKSGRSEAFENLPEAHAGLAVTIDPPSAARIAIAEMEGGALQPASAE
jgi:hypothetical protein